MKRKKVSIKRKVGTLVLTGVAATATLILLTSGGKKVEMPAYTAYDVVDGDTFHISEHQLVRLSGVDAPEIGLCGSVEAKEALSELILGKPLYIRVIQNDPFQRLSSLVYTNGKLVNAEILRKGWAIYYDRNNLDNEEMRSAADEAIKDKRGVFGALCTQTVNPKNPNCLIKANTDRDKKIYHLPSCQYYKNVIVQLHFQDQWFCTENEAKSAGYVKSSAC